MEGISLDQFEQSVIWDHVSEVPRVASDCGIAWCGLASAVEVRAKLDALGQELAEYEALYTAPVL